jgi:hypothetical protein
MVSPELPDEAWVSAFRQKRPNSLSSAVSIQTSGATAPHGEAMRFLSSARFLAVYSGVLTVAFGAVVLGGAAMIRNQTFGVITARRINIVEPDGTVRLTISNRADFPGAWYRKKEHPRPDRREAAGMLFMSEEGSEQGGFIWGASQLPDGSIQNHAHLSLDQYEENQIFAIDAGQEGKDKFSQITMTDQGDFPVEEKRKANDAIEKLPANEQDAAWDKFFATHRHDVKRLALGRNRDGSVGLALRDQNGRVRLALEVRPNGEPVVQLFSEDGQVSRELTSATK